jgi:O-antigen/teichoic acid export membrane protein
MSALDQSSGIINKALSSVKWTAITEIISRTATPIITVVLAKFLNPEDYGIVATAMIVISFSQMLWDAGLSKALIQTEENAEDAAQVVFWTNIVLGCIVYTILFISAPAIAIFFKSPTSTPVLRVLGLQIIISSLTSVQTSLFVRNMDFQRLMWVKLLTAFFPGFFSIPMAMLGHGVWALVAGSLVGQLLNSILLWVNSQWRPAFRYNIKLARKMMRFGFWVLAEAIGGWLQVWGDNLIIGKFLGVRELGVYRLGWSLCSIVYQLLLSPISQIIYPAFSRLQNDRPALLRNFHKANQMLLAVVIPIGAGLLLIGPDIAECLFGNKWEGLGFVISIIGLMFAIGWTVGLNPEIYRAMGKPYANAILIYIQLCYYLPAYYFAAQHGLTIFVYVRLSVCILALPLHIYLCHRMLGTSWNYLWKDSYIFVFAAIVMGSVIQIMKFISPDSFHLQESIVILIITIIAGAILYIGTLALLDRRLVVGILQKLKQVI